MTAIKDSNTPEGAVAPAATCSAPACITIEQDGLRFSSALNDDEDWTILEAVLKRVRNRQNGEAEVAGVPLKE